MTDLARKIDGIPVVANATARDAKYPSPTLYQRVQLADTSAVQIWTGAAWVEAFAATVGAVTHSGLLTASAAAVFRGQLGAGYGRTDAQIEAQNDVAGAAHALISIYNRKTIGDTLQEAALSYQANTADGSVVQMASISAMWSNNASVATGYAVLRLNVDGAGGASDIFLRGFGRGAGVTFYGTSDTDAPGIPAVMFRRASNKPTIIGGIVNEDIAIDANYGGSANVVFLNAYNAGNVSLALGGGKVLIGAGLDTGASSAAGEMIFANAKGIRALNSLGTNTLAMIAVDNSNVVALGGSTGTQDVGNLARIAIFQVGNLNAGAAGRNGIITIDTTNNRFIYYSGGNRYYLAGTSF
jgi:hypothetical protein